MRRSDEPPTPQPVLVGVKSDQAPSPKPDRCEPNSDASVGCAKKEPLVLATFDFKTGEAQLGELRSKDFVQLDPQKGGRSQVAARFTVELPQTMVGAFCFVFRPEGFLRPPGHLGREGSGIQEQTI